MVSSSRRGLGYARAVRCSNVRDSTGILRKRKVFRIGLDDSAMPAALFEAETTSKLSKATSSNSDRRMVILLLKSRYSNIQGKRKKSAKRPSGKKKLEPLPTQFSCLFCNHDDSVVCKLDKVHRVGNLICKVCGQGHQCVINSTYPLGCD